MESLRTIDPLIPYVVLGGMTLFGWWTYANFKTSMESLRSVPGLIIELKSVAQEMKESKAQISKISVIESTLATSFRRIDELREAMRGTDDELGAKIELLAKRIEHLTHRFAKHEGKDG